MALPKKNIITIAGPTAVGKTQSTLALAQQYKAEVFSADSRQLYKEMSIGTAKPTKEELALIPHHFIDHISIQEHYNAGMYERDFDNKIRKYFSNHDVALVTGGTGMYIRAALEGLDVFPDISEEVRKKYEIISKQDDGLIMLQQMLRSLDPEYAQSADMENPRRLTRALEVIEVSGSTFSSFLKNKTQNKPKCNHINICLTRDRAVLYERINTRVDKMMELGLLDEATSLYPYKHLKALQTVGYSEIFQHIDGSISLSNAIELIKRNSRRYAKRQLTWFRNQGQWEMINADDVAKIMNYINEKLEHK